MCETVNETNVQNLFIKIAIVEDITASEKKMRAHNTFQNIIILMVSMQTTLSIFPFKFTISCSSNLLDT